MPELTREQVQKTGSGLITLFIIFIFLRINSYFMISESAAVTRIFKTGLRSLLTGVFFLMCRKFDDPRNPTQFEYRNILGFALYIQYLFLGFASIMWSSDRAWSALQVAMDVECVVFVFFAWRSFLIYNDQGKYSRPMHLDYVVFCAVSWIAVQFLLGAIVNPDAYFRATHGGEVQRLGGWIINPNELGMLCVVGAGCMYTHLMRSKLTFWKGLGWVLILLALLLTQSRSSLISFFGTTFYFVLASGKAKLIIPTFVIGVLVSPVLFFTIFVKEGDVDEVMSMTGRLPFWQDLLTYGFTERPLQGFGFMRIYHTDRFPSIRSYPGAMTHNTFMQLLLNLGLMGAVTCGSQMLFTFRGWMREQNKFLKHLGVGMFIGIFVNSLTEFGIFGDANYGIMWWLFIVHIYFMKVKGRPNLG
ncbi:O-antigen ligase family protein [Pontibacter sp. G13]|uniref:O-antigen ligase family protein n=1 Tax=Pontibacter sp. G13 TaxID=3074898 RepID=UPI00288BFBB9|nr:O-antigen ligase family protein [Pontibacter sp. G13]WNJ19313.1 O-antigen ligase family protein [Pontibacter sp. G13]